LTWWLWILAFITATEHGIVTPFIRDVYHWHYHWHDHVMPVLDCDFHWGVISQTKRPFVVCLLCYDS
jgi:hypothetical protein